MGTIAQINGIKPRVCAFDVRWKNQCFFNRSPRVKIPISAVSLGVLIGNRSNLIFEGKQEAVGLGIQTSDFCNKSFHFGVK